VKPKIDRVRSDPFQEGKVGTVSNTEGEIEFLQGPKRLHGEPRCITELEGMPKTFGPWEGREKDTELLQSFLLKLESWRKLPENDGQFLFQRACVIKEQ
jgi:hypothetical protein